MNELQLQRKKKLKRDFPFYAKSCLQIRTKDKGVVPFHLNQAQLYIHSKIEEQKESTGRVRAVILKGRQQGASTYIEGRLMWKTTHTRGVSSFILTHEDDATQNLFAMSKRYYEHLPIFVKPEISSSNAKELMFKNLDSGYKVGTAGNKSVGRSQTNQFFHGSEVAFWPNAAEHAKGVLQTVPDSKGTEVIYESTANGMGNFFHEQWKKAESGESKFIAIFVPWFWQDEYRASASDIVLTDEEMKLKEYYGLDDEQLAWRRFKIIELSTGGMDGEKAFKQEYPNNAAEAFQVTGKDGLISSVDVLRARKAKVNGSGDLIVGVDPSRGGDRFSIIKRHGRKAYGKESYVGESVDKLGKQVSICKQILDTICPVAGKVPDMMFIDAGGGIDIADRLHELGYEDRVKAIHFGATPLNTRRYTNKRGEMWGLVAQWLTDEHEAVELPDDDVMQADLCASPYNRDSHDRMVLWKKDKIKAEYGFSPDDGDAIALTFAEPVSKRRRAKVPQMKAKGHR